jgi:dTMP kinase
LAKEKREEEIKATKAARELAKAEREAEKKAKEAERAAEEAKEKAAAKRISDAKLKLLKAEAAQDDALTHEMRKQLELEQSIQDIMQSTNLDRAQAVKLAKDLAKASAGADTNQSGYVTPREQRAAERKQRKEDQERRRRERQERTGEVGASERKRRQEIQDWFSLREKESGYGPGATKPSAGGVTASDKQDMSKKPDVAELKEQTKLLTSIEEEIKRNP